MNLVDARARAEKALADERRVYCHVPPPDALKPMWSALGLARSSSARAAYVVTTAWQIGVLTAEGAMLRLASIYLHGETRVVIDDVLALSEARDARAAAMARQASTRHA